MKFGLNTEQFQFILDTIVNPLKAQGARVWCYGSRARGDHHPFSDLDLMIDSSLDLSLELGKIREQLSNSNFPFKVDLVLLSEFAKTYLPQFEKDKVEI
jgi:uncharacterized protein